MEIHQKEEVLTFAQIERKTPVLRPALQLNQSFWCDLHGSRDQGGGEPICQIVSIKEAADGSRLGRREIMNDKREKNRNKNESLRNSSSTDTKGATCLILKNHASVPVRKKRLSPASKTKREASRNKFVKKERGARRSRVLSRSR